MNLHEIDYAIHGNDMQVGSIELDPKETVIAKAGNMKSIFFREEGLFLGTMQRTGKVHLQNLPFSRLANRIIQ